MNNHEGKELKPSIAKTLIKELFLGQTKQLQEIKTKVEEVHAERGGLPSTAQFSPVQRALGQLKKSGLAENTQLGYWSIRYYIKTLDEFIRWANQFEKDKYVFRGVSNEVHGIRASASLRPDKKEQTNIVEPLEKKKRDFERFLHINKDLIRKAKQRGYNKKDGTEFNILEILAELQHYGAATCLIDFTYSAQIALWFACQPAGKKQEDNKESKKSSEGKQPDKPPNGKVYAVKHKPPRSSWLPKCIEITPEFLEKDTDKKKDINYYLQEGKDSPLYSYQPKYQNPRIIAQQSVFMFGQYEFEADYECVIAEKCKENIRNELHRVSGITEETLFPDFEGFASWVNRKDAPYTEPSSFDYRQFGLDEYRKGNVKEAIDNYDKAIEINPNFVEVYHLRGLAQNSLGKDMEAIEDFTSAIILKPDYTEVYILRGKINEQLERYDKAIADFDKVIQIRPNNGEAYFNRGIVNSKLKLNEDALEDFNEAIRLKFEDYIDFIYFCRGLVKYNLEEYDDALEDFDEAINLTPTIAVTYFHRGLTKHKLSLHESAIDDFNTAITLDPNNVEAFYYRAEVKAALKHFPEARQDLEVALELASQQDNVAMQEKIEDLLNEIETRTGGGSHDEE